MARMRARPGGVVLLLLAVGGHSLQEQTDAHHSVKAAAAPGNWEDTPTNPAAQATYFISDERDGNLVNMRAALEALGYTPTSDPDTAHVAWVWRFPFDRRPHVISSIPGLPQLLARLKGGAAAAEGQPEQPLFINHHPGTPAIANKQMLAALSAELPFLPRTFQLPGQHAAWQAFLKTREGVAMAWVQKRNNHGGVEVVTDTGSAELAQADTSALVQQRLVPALIHNRLWDFGLYFAVTSLSPLQAYVHTGRAPIRFCTQDYVANLDASTPKSAYVIHVSDLVPPSQFEPVKGFFANSGPGLAAVADILALLDAQGINATAVWLQAQRAIVQLLQVSNARMVKAERVAGYPLARTQTFELYRADFILDETHKLYLMEVNMSPAMLTQGMPVEQQLDRQEVIHDILSVKGLGAGGLHHPATPPGLKHVFSDPVLLDVQEPACAGECRADCSSSRRCALCHACRTPEQTRILQQLQAEQFGSRNFLRIHPPHQLLAGFMVEQGVQGVPEVRDRPDDALVASWLAAKCRTDPRWC